MDCQDARPRINGAMLSNFIDRNVCLMGEVSEVNPNGMQFKIKASDGQMVTVNTNHRIQDYMESVVEVQGKVTSGSSITSDFVNSFPAEYTKEFDMASYNEAVILGAKCK